MIEQTYLDLLNELSADTSAHSGRTLMEHLIGTQDLLEAWGNPPGICAAGLFHSIYGTQYYRVRSADPADRTRISDVIGIEAEVLAYLFCTSDRALFFGQAGAGEPTVFDREAEATVPVTKEQLTALLEIEVANCVEQFRPDSNTERRVRAFERMLELGERTLTPGASEALRRIVEANRTA